MGAKEIIKNHWGKIYFSLWCVGSLIALLTKGLPSGHFDIFISAPRTLFQGQSPYGIFFPSGAWVYSPLAAIFYAPFAFVPYALGLGTLMALSVALFCWGFFSLLKLSTVRGHRAEALLFILTSEIIGAILNARLEIVIAGTLMLALSWIIQKRNWLPWILLAVIANFKFQALAPVGLLLAYFVVYRKSWTELLKFLLMSLLCILLPALVWGWNLNFVAHRDWLKNVGEALEISFYTFQHIYAFLRNSTGWEIPYHVTKYISLIVAGFLGVWVLVFSEGVRNPAEDALRPIALGCAYVCVFSPASQSAAFILYAPFLLFYFGKGGAAWKSSWGRERLIWLGTLLAGWFFVSLAYSDIVGQDWRDYFFRLAIKPLGILLMLGALLYFEFRNGLRD